MYVFRSSSRRQTCSPSQLNDFFSDDTNMDVTGYRTRAKDLNKTQPFAPDKIVLLQDGGCGSTCAVFAEFMKTQGRVQQVVVGGRPATGPMQGVAGSKGAQVYYFTQLQDFTTTAYSLVEEQADPGAAQRFNQSDVGSLMNARRPLMRTAYQLESPALSASGVNLRDNVRLNDSSNTPLEFIFEAADCRLFYTADMVRDVSNVWRKVVDARWGPDANAVCVDGSTAHKSALSGGDDVLPDGTPTSQTGGASNEKTGAAPRIAAAGSFGVAAVAIAVGAALTM